MVRDCCTIRDAIKEAIEPCAKLLGYKPSALQYDPLPLCGLPEHSQDKLHPVSRISLEDKQAFCKRIISLTERQLCWFTGKFLLYFTRVLLVNYFCSLGYTKPQLCSLFHSNIIIILLYIY